MRTTWVICAVFWATVFRLSAGLAQTVDPITPSGLNTQVNLSATPPAGTVQYDITGGTRSGTNLFHSFGEFGVPSNNIANFLNDTGSATSNILGRVTGGNVSNIFGTIQTTGFGNANLFLMNPAGIVFGPNASLNVGGSVAFTTADYLRLDKVGGPNAGIFHADPALVNLLTSASLDAFGFFGANPGDIAIQGSQLTVPGKQGIALVGGNITIENGSLENGTVQPALLSAPNGQINLATATSPGEFLQDLTAAPNINGISFRSLGSVHITPGSTVDFSQTGNGKVSIRGGQLVLEIQNTVIDTSNNAASTAVAPGQDAIILTPGSSIISQTSSEDRGPDIHIVADRLQFVGSPPPHLSEETLGPRVNIWARTDGSGDAGNIALRTTGDLEMIDLVRVESTSGFTLDGKTESPILASGNAGNIDLTSTQGNIRMTGIVTWATSQTGNSSGETGNVTASAPEGDIILDAANLFTRASSLSSRGGQVQVTAQNLRMMNFGLLSTDNFSLFKPDGITVTLSGELRIAGGFITTSSVNDTPAGDISLKARDIVVTQGTIINSAAFASGSGGQLKIVADTLQLTGGAQLSSGSTRAPNRGTLPQNIDPSGTGGDITIQTLGPTGSVLIDGKGSGIFADTEGTSVGGSTNLSAKSLTVQNSGTISASTTGPTPNATGGSIDINTADRVTMTNGASITASSIGQGDAGTITIIAGQQFDMRDSSVTAKAEQASGGNIDVQAVDRIRLVNSTISSSVQGDPTTVGGNITLDPNIVVLQNSSKVIAQAAQGTGGDITITTPLFLADSTSEVSASSQFGVNGRVTIQSPTSNVSGSLGPLPSKPSQAQALLTQRCAALAGGQASSFVVAGREQLPADPGGWLSSPFAFAALDESPDAGYAVATAPTIMPIADHDTGTVSLRRIIPAGFLLANFADSGATGCRS